MLGVLDVLRYFSWAALLVLGIYLLIEIGPRKFASLLFGYITYQSIYVALLPIQMIASIEHRESFWAISDAPFFAIILIAFTFLALAWGKISTAIGLRFLNRLCPSRSRINIEAHRERVYFCFRVIMTINWMTYLVAGLSVILHGRIAGSVLLFVLSWHSRMLILSRARQDIGKGFVLFLRRFNSFADKSIIDSLLKCVPRGWPALFLVSPKDAAATWDPYVVGLAGLTFTRPLENTPQILSAPLDNWKNIMLTLITESKCIVIDATERSESMDYELNSIIDAGQQKKTVLLIDASMQPNMRYILPNSFDRIIRYHKEWQLSTSRIISYSPLIIASVLMIISGIMGLKEQLLSGNISHETVFALIFRSIMGIAGIAGFFLIVMRMALPRTEQHLLRNLIDKAVMG